MTPKLPPLRRRIFLAYSLIVAVFVAALLAFALSTDKADADIFNKVLSRNYDSIHAASELRRDWFDAGQSPEVKADFLKQLHFARANITEPGEAGIVERLEAEAALRAGQGRSPSLDGRVDRDLRDLVRVNEEGMRILAGQARRQWRQQLWALLAFAVLTLALTLLAARRLARGLAAPLIQMAQQISRPPALDQPLRLPEADSRELEVLRLRLQEWWDQGQRQQRQRLEDEFIGVLSHELKTPLQSLGMAAELLDRKRDLLDPSVHVFLDTILEDLGRIRAVANDFVQVSQLNVRSIRLNLDNVDLGERLKEWLKPFEVLATVKGVRLTLEAPAEGGLCRLDPVKFSWVVSNLLSNALRVSGPGQAVRVRVEDQKLFVELRVEDEGPGIPPEVERRMFEPYYQGQGTEGERHAGLMGLGLTIAKEMVEAHEGAIEYFRGDQGGSVFRVLLPAAGSAKAGERP